MKEKKALSVAYHGNIVDLLEFAAERLAILDEDCTRVEQNAGIYPETGPIGDTLTLTGSSGTLTAHRRPTSSPTRQTTSSPTSIGTRTTAASDARAQLVGTWQVTDIAGRPSGATTTLWFRGGPDGQGSVSWPLADDPGWVKASFRASVGGCPAWSSDTYGVVEGRLRVGGPATYGVYDCTTDTGPDAERLADRVGEVADGLADRIGQAAEAVGARAGVVAAAVAAADAACTVAAVAHGESS